jgi:uncharacterized protein YciI
MSEQEGWPAHARFMNELVNEGFVVLGGPIGDGTKVLLIVEADSEEVIQRRIADDPWTPLGLLPIESIDPWQILLGAVRK